MSTLWRIVTCHTWYRVMTRLYAWHSKMAWHITFNTNKYPKQVSLDNALDHTPGCVGWCRQLIYDGVIKWKHFPRYLPFVQGFHRSSVNSPHKGQWRGALMLSLICAWIKGWVNNREAGDLRRYRVHYVVTVMKQYDIQWRWQSNSCITIYALGIQW